MHQIENLADTQEARKAHQKAGRVAGMALRFGARQIKPGASMREVLDSVEEYIRKNGCELAFPAQSSINTVAAHFCPTDTADHIYADGELVKLDCGAHYDGYIGDNAITVSLGGKDKALADAALAALRSVERNLRPGATPFEIGSAIAKEINDRGFLPIRNLTGHGLGRFEIHTTPSMPNHAAGDRTPLVENQVIAVEPFATNGTAGMITNGTTPTIFGLQPGRPVRSQYARDVVHEVEKYQGLPFTTRWLTRSLGGKALLGLTELRRSGALIDYPPLIERSGGLVAQQEHTFLITKNGCQVLTKDDD